MDVTVRAVFLPQSGTASRLSPVREVLLGLVLFALYTIVNVAPIAGREQAAARNGRSLYALEQALHIDIEHPLNNWLADQPVWRVIANYEYALTYIVSAFVLFVWLYRRHPERYRPARNAFALINLLGALCFAVYPVEPPRLVPELGFIDTVRQGNTWGSWGSPLVEHANQLAAMPSLHVAWALWVSVELAKLSARRSVQTLSALHILVTMYVIMATANHYILDAVGAVGVVWFSVAVTERRAVRAGLPRVPAADSFFLAVESPTAPQHVGGLVMLDTSAGPVTRADLVAAVQRRLDELPRFRQRLDRSRWRRPRWVDHPVIDWDWHVPVRDLTLEGGACGQDGLTALVAELQAETLPRDRPLWRLMLVEGVEPGRSAVVFLMHHVVADGIGVVLQALQLMDQVPPRPDSTLRRPGVLRTAAGVALGLGQLMTEGPRGVRLPVAGTPERRFTTLTLPFDEVRDLARHYGVRVGDVVLCAVAGGLRRVCPSATSGREPSHCRITVPLMMRWPGTAAEGNYTAAVMIDLPLDDLPEAERLAVIARRSHRLRTGTRALASRFVMQRVGQLLPPPVHARFARAVYGGRFFQGIVSNLPGPDQSLRLAGARLAGVWPILPLAPRAPLAIGALSWNGELNFGISIDVALTKDARLLGAAMHAVIDELAAAVPAVGIPPAEGDAPAGTSPAGGASCGSGVRLSPRAARPAVSAPTEARAPSSRSQCGTAGEPPAVRGITSPDS